MKEQPISFPLTNAEFLKVISNSFCRFLRVKTSRSPEKLKPLHGAIAADLSRRLGEGYHICSQGFGLGKEFTVRGRYVPKRVDITIFKQDKVAAGVAVKFVMQNYSQNSNNYFENMLGETANIRAAGYPYFQIFIIQDQLPYYRRDTHPTVGDLYEAECFQIHLPFEGRCECFLSHAQQDADLCGASSRKSGLAN